MALYAISAVYFAGVMVRLMLTLTPVVCMLSAIAFSSVFEHYLGDNTKKENPPAEDSSDEDDKRNSGNLYDKVAGSCVTPGVFHCRVISAFCSFSFVKLTMPKNAAVFRFSWYSSRDVEVNRIIDASRCRREQFCMDAVADHK